MATSATNALSISTTSALIDAKAAARQPASASPQCVTLPTLPLPPFQSQSRLGRKMARNVVTLATTGEAPTAAPVATPTSPETSEADTSELLKSVQEAWDKVEDKYAVSSLAVAGFVGLWGSAGLISAIDKLPLIPGVLEIVGIGYSGWFAYKNLLSADKREALIQKIKDTYKDTIG
ncbi:unnamed protein product [Amaranthus hypochondriacus]